MNLLTTKGFTLIEMLVTVSIIGFLSAIIFAELKNARGNAELRQFEQTLVQIRTATQFYIDEYGTTPDIDQFYSVEPLIESLSEKGFISDQIKIPSKYKMFYQDSYKKDPDFRLQCGIQSDFKDVYSVLVVYREDSYPILSNLLLNYCYNNEEQQNCAPLVFNFEDKSSTFYLYCIEIK